MCPMQTCEGSHSSISSFMITVTALLLLMSSAGCWILSASTVDNCALSSCSGRFLFF